MIDKFEVGKWYVFDAGEDSGITWNPYGKMDFLKDGKPHKCTAIRGSYPMYANFDGHTMAHTTAVLGHSTAIMPMFQKWRYRENSNSNAGTRFS